ncbi:MAG TPA: hypothetical protein VFR37_05225, partial [Longimicrobium sp.]|nr:hypothetical protein [Longimicrobium sp.]
MAILDIDFNCMCLFVPGRSGVMHVLLPTMGSHGGMHTVALVYEGLAHREVVRMEKWELLLRGTSPAATPSSREAAVRFRAMVPSLTAFTGRRVAPKLLTDARPAGVTSRVSLRGTRIIGVDAQKDDVWEIKRKEYILAHKVTLRLENVPDTLTWGSLGARGRKPLDSLRDVRPTDPSVPLYRLSVFHVLTKHLPPARSDRLTPRQIKQHFARYYPLIGISSPGDELLPEQVTLVGP